MAHSRQSPRLSVQHTHLESCGCRGPGAAGKDWSPAPLPAGLVPCTRPAYSTESSYSKMCSTCRMLGTAGLRDDLADTRDGLGLLTAVGAVMASRQQVSKSSSNHSLTLERSSATLSARSASCLLFGFTACSVQGRTSLRHATSMCTHPAWCIPYTPVLSLDRGLMQLTRRPPCIPWPTWC